MATRKQSHLLSVAQWCPSFLGGKGSLLKSTNQTKVPGFPVATGNLSSRAPRGSPCYAHSDRFEASANAPDCTGLTPILICGFGSRNNGSTILANQLFPFCLIHGGYSTNHSGIWNHGLNCRNARTLSTLSCKWTAPGKSGAVIWHPMLAWGN